MPMNVDCHRPGGALSCLAALALLLPHSLPLAATSSTATFRPLVRLTGTEGVYLGKTPAKDIFTLNGKIYATTQYGGKEEGDAAWAQYETYYRQWGRLLTFTDPGNGDATSFTSLDASSAGAEGADLGADLQYFALDSNDRLVGTRRRFSGGLGSVGLTAQASGIITWLPASAAFPSLHLVGVGTPAQIAASAYSIKPRGLWAADKQGNVYGNIYMHGSSSGSYANNTSIYRINAANELHVVAPFLTKAVYGEATLQIINIGESQYVVYPHGYGINSIVFSEDHGGTLYILAGDDSATTWNGTYPNSSIPEGDTASAAIVSISLASVHAVALRELSLTPKATLQSLAAQRDGLLRGAISESPHLDQPSALLEVGDYLYGTTVDTLWRYRKLDATGAAITDGPIEQIHRFSAEQDGAIPQGRLILAIDGYLYGTTYEGGQNGHGSVFRVLAGQTDLAQESASYEQVHSFDATTDGSRPLGLNAGPVSSDGKSQVLYGAAREGGDTTSTTDAGNGTFFALDILLADDPAEPSVIAIELFTVNGSASLNVTPGAALQFEWSSSNANICVVDGENIAPGTGGLPSASGSQQITAPGVEGNYTYTLTCMNTTLPDTEASQAQVIVAVAASSSTDPEEPETEAPAQPQDPGPDVDGGGSAGLLTLASILGGLLLRRNQHHPRISVTKRKNQAGRQCPESRMNT